MFINDIKKGTKVSLTHGRTAVMADNKKGNIRMVEITGGGFHEFGSVYAKDILSAEIDGHIVNVELSPAQHKAATNIRAFGF